jgi:hypothetical protein
MQGCIAVVFVRDDCLASPIRLPISIADRANFVAIMRMQCHRLTGFPMLLAFARHRANA